LQLIYLSGQDVGGLGYGSSVGVEIGMDGMILADPLMEKIDVIGGGQMTPARQQLRSGPAGIGFHGFYVPKQFVLRHIAQPPEGITGGIRPGGGGQSVDVHLRTGDMLKMVGDLRGIGQDYGRIMTQRLGKAAPEGEYTLVLPYVLADVFVVETQQHRLSVNPGNVGGIQLRREGTMWEAEGDVVA